MFPLTSNQRAIWFDQKLFPHASLYNVPAYTRIRGNIDTVTFGKAIELLIAQSDVLRTEIFETDGIPHQVFKTYHPSDIIPLQLIDLSAEEDPEAACMSWMQARSQAPLAYHENRLFTFALLKKSEQEYFWFLNLHHTIADAWSNAVMIKRLAGIYEALIEGKPVTTEAQFPYADYITDNLRYLGSAAWAEDEQYWRQRFATVPRPTAIGIRDAKTEEGIVKSVRKTMYLSGTLYENIQRFAATHEVTLFHTFLATLYTYFSRVGQNQDLVIGAPVLNRNSDAFKNTVGLFVGILPVRMSYPADIRFEALVPLIRDRFREDMQHQRFPVDEIVRILKAKEPDLRSLYDITLSYEKQNYSTPIGGHETQTASIAREGEKEPLAVFVRSGRTEQELKVDFDFNTGYWDTFYIEQFLEQFRNVLETLIHNPALPIDKLPLVTEATRNELLRFTPEQPVMPGTLVKQFERTVAAYPEHTAVVFGENKYTYVALNAEVNALAHYLRNRYDVQPEEIVAYMIPKSDKAIIALLAILKAGGAYLPIDPGYPEERKRYMLEDSGARLLLTTRDQKVPSFDGHIVAVDGRAYLQESNADPALVTLPGHISYIIYTSGSTGKPKGAVIRNEAAVNIVLEYLKAMQIKPTEHCLQFASLSFDASVLEIFMALFSGAALYPVSKDTIADFDRFSAFIDEHDIAALILPPSFLRNLDKNALAKVRVLLTAGEPALSRRELGLRGDQEYYNAYGPTECTVCATIFEETEDTGRNVPIGKAIGNVQVFILDRQQQLLPPGVPGEICISGLGLGLGYLNNPTLTAEKFIPSPFETGKLMYRTGDIGRRLSDGNIEYLGRADDQVKIRGHRIEPGEIEAVLARHLAVQNVAVVVADRNNEKSLYAFVVIQGDTAIDTLYAFLRNELPHFMIPDRIFPAERIPLTMNGKVDRRALLQNTTVVGSDKVHAAPATDSERLVAGLWQELLDLEQVSTTDNFFQLGGHSLKVGQFINKLHRQTGVRLAFSDVFHTAVLRDLALLVDERERSGSDAREEEIRPAAAKPFYPLSSSQKRLYLLHQAEGSNSSYNIPRVFEVKGTIDAQRLEQCFRALIQRHESLRTAFSMLEGVPVQHIVDTVPFSIEAMKASVTERDQVIAGFIRTFDLAQPPLLRAGLCTFDDGSTLFLFDMHHIISDGLSAALLIDELIRLYQGETLEPLALQYKDFAEWQQNFLSSDAIGVQKDYWLRRFADEIPVFNLQTDFPRPAQKSFKGKRRRVTLPKDAAVAIEAMAAQLDCTVNQLLLAAFKVILFKYSANEDIVVGTPVAGRTRAELDKILGVFINTLALRSFPTGDKTFRSFLDEVRQMSVDALKNQDFPFELLVEQLDLKRDRSRHPLFDVMFSFLYEERDIWTLGDAVLEPVRSIYDTSKFDILLEAVQTTNGIALNLEYSTDLFLEGTMVRFMDHYVRLLQQLPMAVEIPLSAINILSNEEEQELLLAGSKDLHVSYPEDKCLHQLFEEQVQRAPDNIALAGQDVGLSYAALDKKVNRLAAAIQQALPDAVNPIIAVLLDRGADMVVAMLAILKAGGAYLPIDPEYPEERIAYTLEDSNAPLLITQSSINKPIFEGIVLNVDELQGDLTFTPVTVHPSDLAYIIYTSGSTGKPKGVMIEHRNVVRLLFNDSNLFDFSENDTWTLFHSYCFDFSVWELYGALLFGGKLVIVPKAIAQSAPDFLQLMRQHRVTVLNQTPGSFYNIIAAELEQPKTDLQLRYVIFGGEALKPAKLKEWHQRYPGCQLINMYGITETTVHVTYKEIGEKEIVSNTSNIGRPIPTLSLLVLDKEGKLVPAGVAGELCVGGAGLARGYLNRPELTAERFADHPYEKGARIYKSGDLAKVLSNGDIEYLGRIDHQVKIRGFRIELGEIESKLLLHPEVSDVLVMDKEDAEGTRYLCAYTVAHDNLHAATLRKHLAAFLPDYMIPAFFIVLPTFPLNANGKIDRKKLPQPEIYIDSQVNTGALPVTATESTLLGIWQDVLKLSRIGTSDNFFELGGHSLKATNAVARVYKTFRVSLPLNIFFRNPTIKAQAAFIDGQHQERIDHIQSASQKSFYPLSSSQKRLYLLHQAEGSDSSYNIPRVFEVKGTIDAQRLEQCFRALIQRHESLRTAFSMLEGVPVQHIVDTVPFSIEAMTTSAIERDQVIAGFIRTFDLAQPPLLRAGLCTFDDGSTLFLFDMHHIISDGLSAALLIDELIRLYQGATLEPLALQYKDFAEWQQNFLSSDALLQQQDYWLRQFADEIPAFNLQTDFPRPAQKSFKGKRRRVALPKDTAAAIEAMATQLDCTVNQLLLAAFKVILFKYSANEDIVVGTPVAGRTRAELDKILGVFINTLALRSFPEGHKTFRSFLDEVRQMSVDALKNQDFPFELLVEQLDLKRDRSRHPLFDVMFSFLYEERDVWTLGDAVMEPVRSIYDTSKFDILLEAVQTTNGIALNLEYSTDLFLEGTMVRFLDHYVRLLQQLPTVADNTLSAINILSNEEEQELLLAGSKDLHVSYPEDKCLHQLFEEQVRRVPDNIALAGQGIGLSYAALDEKVCQLAAAIQQALPDAVNPIIAVLLDRGADMVVAMLAILKAGGAYLPIDPEYPEERIAYTLEDSATPLLITHSSINKPIFEGIVLNVDELQGDLTFTPVAVHPSDLAYIIYTSGSTGKPKGVMIEHRNVVRLLFNDSNLFDFSENDTWTLFHSYCFDFSVWELYGALLFGGKLVIVPKAIAQSAPDFLQLMRQYDVTVLNQTPGSFYNIIAAELEQPKADLQLRYVIFGGEALKPAKLKEWHQRYPGCQLINMYGITETTVHVTYKEIGEKEIEANTSNIGRPIPTLSLLVLDKEGKLVPAGVAGELCVGGAGLARGYLNRPELTAERFTDHPYEKGARIYKSGDLAKVLPNGDIEYLGRIDHQVKIRGFRIELGEIESKLLLHPEISDVLVMDKEDAEGTRYLCAYVVAQDTLQAATLRKHLAAFLPDYMIPAFFIVLPTFPLNANGKIDRKKLPQPEETNLSAAAYDAPKTSVEKLLADLWMTLLRVQRIGRNDQFFELGGHSLKAAQLAALIHKHFHAELSIKDIFRNPCLRDMAACIKASASSVHQTIERAPELSFYPASSAEKRLFILDQIDGAGITYNIPMVYAIEGDLDLKKLSSALQEIMRRHEILRTSFSIDNKEVIQVIHDNIDPEIGIYNCDDNKLQEFIRDFIRPFDLSNGPLIRVGLLRTYSGQYFLLMDLHHIIADGVSLDNFMQELAALYQGAELPPLNIQAKDFAWWQRQWLQSPEAIVQKDFWKAQLADEPPLLNMPTDFVRPAVKSSEGDLFRFSIPAPVADALRKTGRTSGATPFMLLLAAYNVLLSKYSGQEDIIIGTAVAGRSHADMQGLIGMFVNTLPLRNFPAPEKTFLEFAEEVKENSLKAIENQDYPFEELLDDLEVRRDMSRNPLFDHMFSYQAEPKEELPFADLVLRSVSARRNISKMDLSLEVSGTGEGDWQACIEYATKLFSRATIQRLAGHFNHILEQISSNPSIRLRDIGLITTHEKERILHFNDAADPASKPDIAAARNIYELFAEKAAAYPDAIAVETDHETITYRELNMRASQLAVLLEGQGCGPDKIIGLYTDRSPDMVTGMLAIFKAGGAYLPIDPEYPQDRIHYMLEDSAALLVLTQRQLADGLPSHSRKILLDEIDWSDEKGNVRAVAGSDAHALAYVIYTSGSTGKPKGVQIEHRSLYNFLLSNTTNYRSGFTAHDVCLSVTTVSFDVSVLELFTPLINGAKLVLVTRENVYDVQALARVIVQKKITFCYMPLSLLQPLYRALKPHAPIPLNKLDVGAEPIKDTVLEQFISLNGDMQIMNGYGPTEATIACSWFTYQPGNAKGLNVSIGKPMHNTRIYIVNEQMQLQPIGVPGELCIAGDGLARGYLNNPQQTAEKFVANPFEPGTRLYKTGDLAQWQEDGNITFIGRKDYQVKIRGFRIELGEIESKLMTHPDVREALVIDKTDGSGDKYLCAYIVSAQALDYTTLKAYLATELPAYMIPSFFICLDKFPLTRNEKIDRKALPEPETGKMQLHTSLAAPVNATEKKLLDIWQTVLDTEQIGTTDNFFELGGNSLRIINMLGLIQADFGEALKVSDLFDKPTIREQAAAVSKSASPGPGQSKKAKRVEF